MKNIDVIASTLIRSLESIESDIIARSESHVDRIIDLHPENQVSGLNLLHYLTMRLHPLNHIQSELSSIGLSSITHGERHTLANIQHVLSWLHQSLGNEYQPKQLDLPFTPPQYADGKALLKSNTRALFHNQHEGQPNIMVTLPSEAASDYSIVYELIEAGMTVARINCSHDDQQVWQAMLDNINKAKEELNKNCTIYMDLSGPKIRTGAIKPKIKKNKKKKTAGYISLKKGDTLHLYRNPKPGHNAQYKKNGKVKTPAGISVTLPDIFNSIKPGHHVWFDDGKIGSIIHEVHDDHAVLEVTSGKPSGNKLKAEKGINLPESHLDFPSLTKKDIQDLPFLLENADIIGYSFVRTPGDVDQLLNLVSNAGKNEIGIVLKIENKEAFDNLPALLFAAMKHDNIGIMIARGDLAIEIGWERIAEVQEEILWLCEAAHVPTIWATQVLEKLAKEGIASRSEITDAAMSGRSECVMLNKGGYIIEALHTLKDILHRMKAHQIKKKIMLRPLGVAFNYFQYTMNQNQTDLSIK